MYNIGDTRGGYTLIDTGLPRLVSQPNRPEGIHLSSILSKIYGYSDTIEPETHESQRGYTTTNLMELGLMFEFAYKHWLSIVEPDRYILDPPGFQLDDIHMTPDLYDINRDAYADMKFTTKSAKACPGEPSRDGKPGRFACWETQIKSYCHGAGCNTGQLRICHVNGIWAFLNKQLSAEEIAKDGTIFNVWERRYTTEELIANWAVILAYKERG